jgi:3-phenylpropionate/trans-cinnamate dioxygenase ferredoxin reductase subunit
MTSGIRILVVGASVAAGAFISQLRQEGFTGSVTVVDRDPDAPYDRPPLSKEFLSSDLRKPEAPWWTGECHLVRGQALHLDVTEMAVNVRAETGEALRLSADHIVVATGSSPIRLPGLPDAVNHLRTASDARRLRNNLQPGHHTVVLGAGTIGTEVASSIVDSGGTVTLIDLADQPLDRFFAGHLGDRAEEWIRDGGVDLRLRTRVEGVSLNGPGFTILTDSAGALHADMVISAVGTRPAVQWLQDSGLDLVNGVQCDADGAVLTRTGMVVPRVHAIGDAAVWANRHGGSRRREDWTSAQRQGRHVARLLAGLPPLQPDDELDYFWSHQFGRRIQLLGTPRRDAVLVTRSEVVARGASFHRLEVDGAPVAWISINSPREFAMAIRDAARAHEPVTQRT